MLFSALLHQKAHTNLSYPMILKLLMPPLYSSSFGMVLAKGGGHHDHHVSRKVGIIVVHWLVLQ